LSLTKVNVGALSSNINLFYTTGTSNVSGYFKLVTTLDDSDYNTTAIDISTGSITGTAQLLGSFVAEPNLFVGNPGIINVITVGNIRKVSGNSNQFAEFYFQVFKRESNGTETLLATSETTGPVNPITNTYSEFNESALLNNGVFVATDRLVVKFFANLLGNSGPVYEFQFGGTNPVRTLLPVPVSVIPVPLASAIITDTTNFNGKLSSSNTNVQSALETLDDHGHAISEISNLQSALDGKEPVFTKNTAFNKNFGTSAGTVLEGSHHGSTGNAHGEVTTSVNGFMSNTDKTKLNGIESGAQVNTVTSVAGKTGVITLSASDVGLGNVTNHAQIQKLSSSTTGNVPTWTNTSGDQLSDGYGIEETLTGGSNKLATASAIKSYVDANAGAADAMIFKGTLGTGGVYTTLPTTYSVGWTFKIITAGTYAGQVAEIGDMIIAIVSRTGSGNLDSDWNIIQTNIDGAVTGPSSSVDNQVVLFNGSSGKTIKSAGTTLNNGTLTLATSGIATGSQTFSANQNSNVTFTVNVPATNLSEGTRTSTSVPITSSTGTDATLNIATTSLAGVMSSTDKTKLDGIESGAQVNVGTNLGQGGTGDNRTITSSTGSSVTVTTATTTNAGFMSIGDKSKLDGVAANANNYAHPTQTAIDVNATDNGINVIDRVVVNTLGHVTSVSTRDLSVATTSANGVMSSTDKSKLDGIATGATANTGTVTSVGGTGTVSGLTLSGTVTTTGNLTLGGTLSVIPSNFSSQTANTFLAAPNGIAGVPTFRAIVAADVPTLNQNTTGTASNVTGTVAIANGGTGATTNTAARTNLGATTLGSNLFTIGNPSAIRFLRVNADNTVSSLTDSDFRTAIGAYASSNPSGYTTNTGTVTSIATNNGLTGGTITTTGTLGLTGQALALHNLATNGIIARTAANTVAARTLTASTGISISNGDGVSGNPTITNTAPHIATNLSYTASTRILASSTGTNVTLPQVTTSLDGLMIAADKSKLDGIAAGAQVNVATNLGYTTAASNGTVTSSTGTNATLPAATTSLAGLMTSADKTKLDGIATSANNYSLPNASSTVYGGVKLGSDTAQTVAANAVTATAARTYAIQVNASGQMLVNVPWVDTNTNTTYSAGNGISLSGTTFSVAGGTGLTQDTNGLSLTAITAGNATVGALRYNSTTRVAGQMYGGTTAPTSTTRVNYDGDFYAYRHYAINDIVAYASDKRLKTKIQPIENAIDKLKKLSGFTFDWNEKGQKVLNDPERQVGVFAQDVKAILPEAVTIAPFDRDLNGKSLSGNDYLTVKYEKLVPLLIEAIKEQQKQIDDLISKIS